jgi:type I restriction enzyme S subunit
MSSEWPAIEIGAIAKLRSGFAFKSADWKESGVPVLKIANIKAGRVNPDGCGYVSDQVAQQAAPWFTKPGDILISMTGYVGEVAEIKECERYLINQRVGRFEFFDYQKIDPKFFFYHLQLPKTRAEIEGVSHGSAQPNLSASDAHKIEITLPPIDEQRKISSLLGALDDRIILLRETNKTLEAIAQAIFKSWFIDFDPVRAKMEGRTPAGMDEETAALFPDELVESELGLVPNGWAPVRLDSFLELAYGKALKTDSRKPGPIPVYGSGGITGWHDTALVNSPSIIVGRKGTVGSLYWETRPFFPIDTVFFVKSNHPLSYCYELLKTLGLQDMNTDAAVPGLNRENVYRLLVPGVPTEILSSYESLSFVLRNRIDANDRLIETLAKLRDTLLPRLISGRLRMPEAVETFVAA